MTHVIDKYRLQIEELAPLKVKARARDAAFAAFRNQCKRSCERFGYHPGDVIDPQPAHDLLKDLHANVLADLQKMAAGYSAVRWLFMLRRIPQDVFAGRLGTTNAYDAALADVISAQSTLDERIIVAGQSGFPVEGSCVRRVLSFCEGVRTLSQVHVLARWCGKGATLHIAKDWTLTTNATAEVSAAIKLYDLRCNGEKQRWSAAGTDFLEQGGFEGGSILYADRIQLQEIPTLEGHFTDAIAMPRLIGTDEIRSLTQQAMDVAECPWPPEAAVAMWIARFVRHYFVRRYDAAKLHQILNTGYLPIHEQVVDELFGEFGAECNQFVENVVGHPLSISSREELLALTAVYPSGVWPVLPRDVVRTLGEMIYIDLFAVADAISESLEYTSHVGPVANARGGHFEKAVRARIDETSWRPEEPMRDLIGRKLKRSGQFVTDIDAVAARNSTLILISCKSRRKPGAYDTGDYALVRNAASFLAEARAKWEEVVSQVREVPQGFNVDFSSYSRILGVVCTSTVFYAPLEVVVPSSADDIRVMGINELIIWLNNELADL